MRPLLSKRLLERPLFFYGATVLLMFVAVVVMVAFI
jgi:hypothetical protein